jgi:hypothetical protein
VRGHSLIEQILAGTVAHERAALKRGRLRESRGRRAAPGFAASQ